MSKHIILSFKPYDFTNDKKERVQGAKISYLNRKASVREGEFGNPPIIANVTNPDLIKNIKEVPGVYEMDFEQVTGRDNKAELMLTDIELIAPADFALFYE